MTDTPTGGQPPPGDYSTYLTARLAALGLSRNALARALGHKGASQVSRWCAGKAVPRVKARAAIEGALREARERVDMMDFAYRAARANEYAARQTPQDAPGTTIPGGEALEGYPTPHGPNMLVVTDESYGVGPIVERYVVEGG